MKRPYKVWGKRQKTTTSSKTGYEKGFRSGLEDRNAKVLLDLGVPFEYEEYKLKFVQPEKVRTYCPDFILPNGIVIETKGRFLTSDRQKHKMIKHCHPYLDLRFVFSNAQQTISKTSKTTYAMWADHNGFQWANKEIPEHWIHEPLNRVRLDAARNALTWEPPDWRDE